MKKSGTPPSARSYRLRTYRDLADTSLVSTYFQINETDLHILAESDVSTAVRELATMFRLQVEGYIAAHPEFATALEPLGIDRLAPPLIRQMQEAAAHTGVGPMAAVAGGIAEFVGRGLLEAGTKELIVENGGDIFLKRSEALTVSVFAGASPLSNRLGLRILPEQMPLGICTSSGTVGHSLSLGIADSVTVLADSTCVADAAATRLGNEIRDTHQAEESINRALGIADEMEQIRGVLIICDETIGARGEIELKPLE